MDAAVRRRRSGLPANNCAPLLEGCEQIADFDDRELRLVEPLRTLRMIPLQRLAGAALGRSGLPAGLPVVWHGHYWMDQVSLLREQLRAMQPRRRSACKPHAWTTRWTSDGDGFA